MDEAYQLLLVAGRFDFLGCAVLALFGGIRPEEVQRMDWSLVHIDDKVIEIPEHISKIHVAREIPINPTMLAWLSLCYREAGPIVEPTNYDDRFDDWRVAAGVTEWPHDALRKAFASHHVAAFKNPDETARQMGHIGGLRTLYKYYVIFVRETVAGKYWALQPSAVPTASAEVAA